MKYVELLEQKSKEELDKEELERLAGDEEE